MRRFFLLITLFVTGCSSTPPPMPPPPRPPMVAGVPITQSPRELGSLWSSDSRWNNVFDPSPFRNIGDTVKITVTEGFPYKLAELKGQAAKPVPANGAKAAATQGQMKSFDAVIQEVLPRNIYRVVIPNARVEEKESGVLLSGLIREKDIQAGETATFDALLNVRLENRPPAPPATKAPARQVASTDAAAQPSTEAKPQ